MLAVNFGLIDFADLALSTNLSNLYIFCSTISGFSTFYYLIDGPLQRLPGSAVASMTTSC